MSDARHPSYVGKTFRAVQAGSTPGDPHWRIACVETGFLCNEIGPFETPEAAQAKADAMTAHHEDDQF